MKTYDVLREIENALRSPFVTRKSVRLLNDFFQNRALLDVTASDGVLSERLTPQAAYLWRDLRREVCQEYPEGPLEQVFPPGALEQVKTYWLEPCPSTSGSGHYVRGRLNPGSVVIDDSECYTVKGPYNCVQGKEVGSLQVVGDCDASECASGCPSKSFELDVAVDAFICAGCYVDFDANDWTVNALNMDGTYSCSTLTSDAYPTCTYADTIDISPTTSMETYSYATTDGSCGGGTTSHSSTSVVVVVRIDASDATTPLRLVDVTVPNAAYPNNNFSAVFRWVGTAAYGDTLNNSSTSCQPGGSDATRIVSGGTVVVTEV